MTKWKKAFEQAKKHARKVYPEESCGFVIADKYVPVKNIADSPDTHDEANRNCSCRLCSFRISAADRKKYLASAELILHSHPDGNTFPSCADMKGQIATNVPWGIIALDEERISKPELWGDQLPVQDLLGRQFMHGIRDCYSVIRDAYRLGKDALEQQGVTSEWPFDPIVLNEVPRDDAWWETELDLYNALPAKFGWVEIKMEEARPGDVFLVKIRSDKFNHAGIMVAQDLIVHHLPGRMSRREPAGLWARHAGRWLRYEGKDAK